MRGQFFTSLDNGFTLLALRFTGAKALSFKLRYIEQFNAMEAQLKLPAIWQHAIPTTSKDIDSFLSGVDPTARLSS
ncbi:Rha family transcriptional regulator [Rhizobium sp. 42MFCr.1]|uniref:Rha family transcriptional regulator n=1 Tax=Rhizobium sp. 42MFCr.1 TaxID=1048680 RepID=UPI000A06827A|nr:Rha family transcriptional regulator [Rhizobium sp. 42MFCr.1]